MLTGGCLCGGVRWELDQPPLRAGYCHCTRCQRRTGTAASPSAWAAPGSFRIVEGEELVRAYAPPDGFEKTFCTVCGSALFSRDPANHDTIGVRFGSFDEDPGIRPSWRQHLGTAAAWEAVPDDGLEHHPGPRPA